MNTFLDLQYLPTVVIWPGLVTHSCAREGVVTLGREEVKLTMIPEEENVMVLDSEGKNKGFEPWRVEK